MELQIFLLCAFAFQFIQDASAYPAKGHPYKSEHCIKMTPEKEQEINAIITRITDFLDNITAEFEDYDIRLIKLDIESHSEDEVEEKEVQLQLTVNDCTEEVEGKDNLMEKHDEYKETNVTLDVPVVKDETTEVNTITNAVDVSEKCSCASKNDGDNEPSKYESNLNTDNTKDNSFAPVETIWFFDFGKNNDDYTYDGIQFFDSDDEIISHKNEVTYKKNEVVTAVDPNKDLGSKKPELMPLDLTDMDGDVWEILEKRRKPLLVYVQSKTEQDNYIFL